MSEWDHEGQPPPETEPEAWSEESLELLLIHGQENRVPVADDYDPNAFPWSCLCELRCDFPFGQHAGTGWLIGPRTVVTAGHCVFRYREWARSVQIGRPSGTSGGTVLTKTVRSTQGWQEITNPAQASLYDYGAVFLAGEDAIELDDYLSPDTNFDADDLEGTPVLLAGYPLSHTELMYHQGPVESKGDWLTYRIDTSGGQSGSPVLLPRGDAYDVIGIHIEGHPWGNHAIRMRQGMVDLLQDWRDNPR